MLVRIVKMSFKEEAIEIFLDNFDKNKNKIRNFEGCRLLELYRDKEQGHIFFSYSYWEDQKALDSYRESALFQKIWGKTKLMFSEKPMAWSVDKIDVLK